MEEQDIYRLIKEWDVKFVRLQFIDIMGVNKNVAITLDELPRALAGEIMFDGSSIEGFARIQESDMYLRPDLETFAIFPWRPRPGAVARLICDVYTPGGRPFSGCPRFILRRCIQEAADMGFSVEAGPEPEFFLFQLGEKGQPTTITHDQGSYFDLAPTDQGEDARRDIVLHLEKMGFSVESSHHEVAPGQHEIDFKYAPALKTADNISTFRLVTKVVAKAHGLHATFMPKPLHGIAGSGMHIHQSLHCNGENAFFEPDSADGLSSTARHYIGGILHHARSFTAITNPLINSYKRLVSGFEAPIYVSWSGANRSALVRIPAARGNGTRLELRSPDPSANPYLALAVNIKAGLDGIRQKIEPGPQTSNNIFTMTGEEKAEMGIAELPRSLEEALNCLEKDPIICSALGEHIRDRFIDAKRMEIAEYREVVHDWELDRYLQIY